MKQFCYLLISFALSSHSFGQDADRQIKERSVKSFEFRAGFVQQKESNLHDKLFNGLNYTFQYSKTLQKKNLSHLNLSVGNSHLTTDLGEGFSSTHVNLGLDYHYLFKIYNKNNWKIYSGLLTNLNYNIGYYWIWDESHLYWANFLSINLSQRYSYAFDENKHLTLSFSVPVVLFLSRPESKRDFKIDDFSILGVLESLHYKPQTKFLTESNFIKMSMEYQYQRKSKIQPFFSYTFNYLNLKTTYSNSAQSIQHLVGLKWDL
ncbi:MAG: hypothetical protein Q8S14_18385 [Algoriphagus sp.]|uniref:hypothetical protein n=1 Tax=Algoriphagus sp. TaxID=1872435 RepID=UPI00273062A5|nr:hypothetical protein [Algoriphagus sp.]MDP2040354.1 hypothetical protein [Algoriphagus sp.]MDP3473843.1 hypothetical protein [Algoriphagus sp.]